MNSRRAVPVHEDIRERQRRRQRKKKRIRFTFFCICIALAIVLAACAIVFLTPWFHVSHVQVQGNAQLETADLIAASEIKKGESIFAFSIQWLLQREFLIGFNCFKTQLFEKLHFFNSCWCFYCWKVSSLLALLV